MPFTTTTTPQKITNKRSHVSDGSTPKSKQKAKNDSTAPIPATTENKLQEALQRAITAMMPTLVDNIAAKITESMEKKFQDMQEEIDSLKENLQRVVTRDAMARDRLEQFEKRDNVIVYELEEDDEESTDDLTKKFSDLCSFIGVKIEKEDISAINRLGRRGGRGGQKPPPRPVLAKIKHAVKQNVMVNKKELKEKKSKVVIMDDVTSARRKLLKHVKDLRSVQFAYIKDGVVVAKQTSGTFSRIENADDLFHLGEENIDYRNFYTLDSST